MYLILIPLATLQMVWILDSHIQDNQDATLLEKVRICEYCVSLRNRILHHKACFDTSLPSSHPPPSPTMLLRVCAGAKCVGLRLRNFYMRVSRSTDDI
jgi:hypothetical protein